MASASELRMGMVFIEMGIDQAFLEAECKKARTQVAKLSGDIKETANAGVAAARGGAGAPFLGVAAAREGAGARFFVQGMRAYTGVHVLRAGIEGLTAALREDMTAADAVDAVFTNMPFGIAEYYKAVRDLRSELDGSAQAFRDFQVAADVRGTFVKGIRAIQEFRHSLQTQARLIGATPLEAVNIQAEEERRRVLADANKAGGLGEGHPQIQGALRDVESKRAKAESTLAADERNKSTKTFVGLLSEVHDAIAKAGLSEEAYAEYAIRHSEALRDRTEEDRKALLAYQLTLIRVKNVKKDADEAERLRQQLLTEGGERNLAALKEHQQTLEGIRRSVETPQQTFRRQKGELDILRPELGGEVWRLGIEKALKDAAAALPDIAASAFGHRGTFSGFEAALGMSGTGEVLLRRTAESGEKTARLLQKLADEGTPLVWGN